MFSCEIYESIKGGYINPIYYLFYFILLLFYLPKKLNRVSKVWGNKKKFKQVIFQTVNSHTFHINWFFSMMIFTSWLCKCKKCKKNENIKIFFYFLFFKILHVHNFILLKWELSNFFKTHFLVVHPSQLILLINF
jgi:hypothetical protein